MGFTNYNHPKVAESEIIGANHLGFAKSLFQQYSQQLGLNNNHFSAKSAFNFYVNDKITDCLGETVDIKFTKKNFYTELFQHISLPKNYSFAPIIRKINQTIKRYTQQQFPITYANKGKGRLQIPAVIPKQIQPPTWKKTRVESPTNSSYYYTPGSTINISSTGVSTSHMTLIFGQLLFQSKQKKAELLGTYKNNGIRRERRRRSQRSGIYLSEPDSRKPKYQNSELSDLQNLPLVIIINPPPVAPQQQPLSQPQIQLPLPPPQQPNIDPIVYVPIAKLEKFTREEDDTQIWLNDIEKAITANRWNDTREFKIDFLKYFSNNNSINCLVNIFSTIKQEENKAVTTYLGCFHRNLHQIQAIQADYFTAPQILNQFIRKLYSSILQRVCPMHPADFQVTVTNTRDFKLAELEANHAQAVNLVMNESSKLDFKLKQFSNSINQKLKGYLADNHTIY
ncbi:hypothetical protein G9A89_017464 [Geosiphon pyriformis]|nr:hypothetical protein G9A89_017464 [Geosiphon pyriformis]